MASPLFAYATASALDAAGSTGGLVDPTLGIAIEAAGYDRDFARLVEDERPVDPTAPGQWRSLRLDGRLLWRPAGTKLDLNGVRQGARGRRGGGARGRGRLRLRGRRRRHARRYRRRAPRRRLVAPP
ncbi:MAG: hypothetical protein M3R70_06610 [Actinomycetota bacterium]|nr:hypothetical protein [Actinomycetota bacterium]